MGQNIVIKFWRQEIILKQDSSRLILSQRA